MKRLLTLVLILTLHPLSHAQVPRMTVREPNGTVKPLHLDQADVSIRILGDIAETVFDLRFRNDGERPVEGEFVMPLPEGATVSGYALEVNGKLRDSVAVEKQRARNAYESVKRRMIDPGLVERETGNTYRTKVFPVPAKGTKRLRISYTETLRAAAGDFTYSLPLDFPEALNAFSCAIRGLTACPVTVADPAGLEFTTDLTGNLTASLKVSQPTGTLKLLVRPPAGPLLLVEDGEDPAFYLTTIVPGFPVRPRPRPVPAIITLMWDASLSGLNRDHTKELSLLDAWFAQLGKTHVRLQLLRNRLEDGGEFDVRDGQWAKLKQTLQQIDYDGATVRPTSDDVDFDPTSSLNVYVGDGVTTLDSGQLNGVVPFVFIHSGTSAIDPSLVSTARFSHGAVIDLATETPGGALAKLTQHAMWSILVRGLRYAPILIDQDLRPGQRLRLSGTLSDPQATTLELCYHFGDDCSTCELTIQRDARPAGLVRRLHAQRVLADLEHRVFPDRRKIIDHCTTFGLVSDHTSLIVLERIEDYAQYQIPPPEPELQADYQRLVAMRAAGLAGAWAAKLHWYGQAFPGYDALIQPRLQQVGIWKQAIESQFAPAQRDPAALAIIAGWHHKATSLISERPKLLTKDDYQKWKSAIDEMNAQGTKLAQTPLHPPPAGQALTVSVRGWVARPGLVTGDPGMTLRQAITKIDVPQPLANLDFVALYRNAGKTVYNTLSQKYQDVPLLPGDMIVVEQPPFSDGCADPFAAREAPPAPANEGPIRQQQDLWTGPPTDHSDLFASAGAGGAAEPASARSADAGNNAPDNHISGNPATAPPSDPVETTPAAMAEFARAIAAGADPQTAYRTFSGRQLHPPRFYLDAARILFAKHHDAPAIRVLSNLVESNPGDLSAIRSYVFWLAEFGQAAAAEAVLNTLLEDDLLKAMDLASLRATRRDLAGAARILWPHLQTAAADESGSLATIALTKYNVLYHFLNDPHLPRLDRYPQILTADIRISLTSTGDDSSLRCEVVEPGGQPCAIGSSPSVFGGRVTGSSGVREYMIRNAVPGIYQIRCTTAHPATVRAVIHTHWGRKDQQTKVVTRWLEPDKLQPIGEIQYEFEPMDKR